MVGAESLVRPMRLPEWGPRKGQLLELVRWDSWDIDLGAGGKRPYSGEEMFEKGRKPIESPSLKARDSSSLPLSYPTVR